MCRSAEIIVLMPAFYHGGAEKQFRQLMYQLAQNGFKVTLWSLEKLTDETQKSLTENQIKFKEFRFDFFKYQQSIFKNAAYLYYYLKLAWLFVFNLLKTEANVILSYGMILAPFIPLFKLFRLKVIFSCRTATAILFQRKYLKWHYNCAGYITTNSNITRKYLGQIGVQAEKIIVINNGIELNGKPKFEVRKPIRNIYLIGRVHPIKNHLYVLESLKDYDWLIVFVGVIANERYYIKLLRYIETNKLKNKVRFLNFVEDIEGVYHEADVVILPSKEEGSSNVILECFKYGKICIASNIETNSELLNNRGFLIDINDSQSLNEALETIAKAPDSELGALISNNYEFLLKNYSVEQNLNNYKDLILEEK